MSKESPRSPLRRPARVFYGWWIVAISLVTDAMKQGTFQRGFSIYFQPIQKDLGLSSARYSLAQTIGVFQGGVLAPLAGYLIDRLGPGTMMVVAGAILGLGFILLSFTNNYLYFVLVYVGLMHLASRLGYNNASSAAINQWFRRKRSLALSMLSMGRGIGGAAVIPVVTLMVTGLGWETSARISGIAILAIAPLSLLMRRNPESMGLLPDGERKEVAQGRLRTGRGGGEEEADLKASGPGPARLAGRSGQPVTDPDFSVNEALKTVSFWLFSLAQTLREVAHVGIQWHLARLIVMSGVSLRTAGFFIAFMSFAALIINPMVGWAGDKWVKPRITAAAMVTGALAMLVLLSSSGQWWLLALSVMLLACSETANALNWAIQADFFGRRSYATLRGWQQLPTSLMAMASPVWMGFVFDRTDSFTWVLIPLAILYSSSALVYWNLPSPGLPARSADPPSAAVS